MKFLFGLGSLLFFIVLSSIAWADHHWIMSKSELSARGLDLVLSEQADYVSVFKGGLKAKDSFVGLAHVELTLNTDKAGFYKGGEFFIHATNAHGGLKPTGELVGDLQAVNNNEAPKTSRLYEYWYQQHLWDDNVSLLAGVQDLNSDFMISEYAGLYINGAFGTPTTLTSNVSASVYPLAGPAARIKIKPMNNLEILAGVYGGNPGDPDINEHSTHLTLKSQDGLLSIAEAAWRYKLLADLPGTFKAGAWHHSGDFDDVSAIDGNGDPVKHDDNYGGYVIVDQMIYREKDEQGLGVFFMGSGAPQNRNTVDRQIYAGFNYTGLVPKRDADVLGVAFTNSSLSNKLKMSNGFKRAETAIEGTYQVKLTENLSVQPDFQYVIHPSGDPAIKNASVFTLRTQIIF